MNKNICADQTHIESLSISEYPVVLSTSGGTTPFRCIFFFCMLPPPPLYFTSVIINAILSASATIFRELLYYYYTFSCFIYLFFFVFNAFKYHHIRSTFFFCLNAYLSLVSVIVCGVCVR